MRSQMLQRHLRVSNKGMNKTPFWSYCPIALRALSLVIALVTACCVCSHGERDIDQHKQIFEFV